jgi:SAM-dependent methyltransferase
VADAIVRLAGATAETRFVEPGVGTGRIALPLVRRGYDYTGVDVSEAMMDELRRKLGDGPHRLRLVRADARDLPFADASFDVAISAHVLHLIEDWQIALSEIRRVLQPQGLYLYCEQAWSEGSAHAVFWRRWSEILAYRGIQAGYPGAFKARVLPLLREDGADLDVTVAARWRVPITVGEVLARYEQRVGSSVWRLPDYVFDDAIKDLRTWATERYQSMEVPLVNEITFEIVRVDGWAA